jgi:CheY-like chemotaxis protein
MGATVLVAEDNDDYRAVIRLLLTHLGCTVVEASNGYEAIAGAETTHPDLIIMDWIMPQLGGLEATKRLKQSQKTRDIPIVICTAFGRESLGHRKLLECAQEIIQKPVQLNKIAELVRKYVPQKNQQQAHLWVKNEQHSPNVLEACRALRKVQQTINAIT